MRSVRRFQKKPIEVEAVQFVDTDAAAEIHEWAAPSVRPQINPADGSCLLILIDTLEGTMRADRGDWIIRGVQGEFYPCKPEIFEATYTEVAT